jgi:carbon monoxide dehydrogenase subunit G
MAKIEASVIINRPVEEVWRFVTDLSNAADCFPNTVEIKQTSQGPLGVGSTFLHRFLKQTVTGRCTEYDPSRKFTNEATSGPIRGSTFSFSMETNDGNTRLSLTGDLEPSGFYRLFWPFIAGRSVRQGKVEFESKVGNVKRILESEAQS